MSKAQQLAALKQVRFSITDSENDVWRDDMVHVDGLHEDAWRAALNELDALRDRRPHGNIVLQGRPGLGKTHFLGRLRQHAAKQKSLFVFTQLNNPDSVWTNLAYALPQSLDRIIGDQSQATSLAQSLRAVLNIKTVATNLSAEETTAALNTMRRALRSELPTRISGAVDARSAVDMATALCMIESDHLDAREIGEEYIKRGALDEEGLADYAEPLTAFGKRLRKTTDRDRVIALAAVVGAAGGQMIIALDQLDGLIQVKRAQNQSKADVQLHSLANSIMECAEATPNSLIVISCFEENWQYIRRNAAASAADRFPNRLRLREISSPALVEKLVAEYLAPCYERAQFTPPWPTWPVAKTAFANTTECAPREILRALHDHIQACLRDGEAREMASLLGDLPPNEPQPDASESAGDDESAFTALDAQFTALKAAADPSGVLMSKVVDQAAVAPVTAGLQAWAIENQTSNTQFKVRRDSSAKPVLHGRLIEVVDAATEHENRWSFRIITQTNASAILKRLRDSAEDSGLRLNADSRRLFILRPDEKGWSGPKTQLETAEFEQMGGQVLTLDPNDIATFQALAALSKEFGPQMDGWLRSRRPASQTEMLRRALADVAAATQQPDPAASEQSKPQTAAPQTQPQPRPAAPQPQLPLENAIPQNDSRPALTFGASASGATAGVSLETLRRHVMIFGGSGSGKTVLLRRIIEECALQGVSSIVLDPNNDLARLGAQWPEPPKSWTKEDADKAALYHDVVETTIWTPRLQAGRPLSFQPLAGLADLVDDADEFGMAVEGVVAELAPKARLPKSGPREAQGRAILNQALTAYARQGGDDLSAFLNFLADLPEDVSSLADAAQQAAAMANTLRAAQINDPLFGGSGEAVDPGALLAPPPGKRARVSVISLAWLPDEEQRQTFTAQLQRALFSWIKANPASDNRPLSGLLVMDEARIFAPAGAATPSLSSTRTLAAQARKYGLGLVIATQAPKDLHNTIPGNAVTHLYGRLNSPVQYQAAREIAQQAGAQQVPDFGRLTVGQFFLISEGLTPQRIQTPVCLTWHPPSPLSPHEVQALVGPQSSKQPDHEARRAPRKLFSMPRFSAS